MKRLLILFTSIYLLSSCATHFGVVSTSSINRNVKYEDIAYGVSQVNKFLGIGGLSQDALILEAKRELIKNRPLKPNEEYANFTVDFKKSYLPFYDQIKVTLTADVVKFTNDTLADPFSEIYKSKLIRKSFSNDLFKVGDTILYNKANRATIISIVDPKTVRIEYLTKRNRIRTQKLSINKIYTTTKPYKGLRVGDRFIYSLKDNDKTSGKIIGLGLKSLLVKTNDNKIEKMDYEN